MAFEIGGVDSLPGMGPLREQEARIFLTDNSHTAHRGVKLPSDVDDDENVGKEHKLRAGLALVRVEAAGANLGKYVELTHADAPVDASIAEVGILMAHVNMRDLEGNREEKNVFVLKHGFVDDTKILYGAATNAARKQAFRDAAKLIEFKL